jgi:hypothetical protein
LVWDVSRGLLREAAKPVKQSLDPSLDGDCGMAIPACELEARDTFDLELDEEMAFLEA